MGGFRMSGGCGKIMDNDHVGPRYYHTAIFTLMTTFFLYIVCTSLIYRLHKVVEFTDLCACLSSASLITLACKKNSRE